jgi:hypothetical protein
MVGWRRAVPIGAARCLIVHVAFMAGASASLAFGEEPFLELGFAEALEQARAARRHVLVQFVSTRSEPSWWRDQAKWMDWLVQAWLAEYMVSIQLDAKKESELAARYGVEEEPTILILKPDGSEIDRIVGRVEAKAFLEIATCAVSGKSQLRQLDDVIAQEPHEMRLWLDRGRVHLRAGSEDAALKDFLVAFDCVALDPAFVGVRGGSLLPEIIDLGRRYPPALEALRERREALKRQLNGDSSVGWREAHYYGKLSECLDDRPAIVAMLEALWSRKDRAEVRSTLATTVLRELLAQRRYREIYEAIKEFRTPPASQITWSLEFLAATRRVDQVSPGVHSVSSAESSVRERIGTAFEVLLGVGKLADAAELADLLLEGLPGDDTVKALVEHAVATGPTAGDLVIGGLMTLPAKGRSRLDSVVAVLDGRNSRISIAPPR